MIATDGALKRTLRAPNADAGVQQQPIANALAVCSDLR